MQPTKEGKISVSVMCSDLMNLERDIKQLERNGVDYLHVDVMDAHFVPNLTFGVDFIAAMHRVTKLPLDIHLMVEHPLPIMEAMDIRPGDPGFRCTSNWGNSCTSWRKPSGRAERISDWW